MTESRQINVYKETDRIRFIGLPIDTWYAVVYDGDPNRTLQQHETLKEVKNNILSHIIYSGEDIKLNPEVPEGVPIKEKYEDYPLMYTQRQNLSKKELENIVWLLSHHEHKDI